MMAFNSAPEPPPPVICIVAVVYPVPASVIRTLLNFLLTITASTLAPIPSPRTVKIGVDV
jgi:hypothetical protein